MYNLSGKTAIVTGGAGILGHWFCSGLAEFGAKIAVVDINENNANRLSCALQDRYRVKCMGIGCDVSSPKSVEMMLKKVTNAFGSIQILHNNAATKTQDLQSYFHPLKKYTLQKWREVMATNLDGMFLVAQIVGQHMAERKNGSIIQTGSIYGIMAPDHRIYNGSYYNQRPISTPAVYSASKGGVVALTKYLATYWGKDGVRANTLTPGGVWSGQNQRFKKNYSARVPLGRMAIPSEMVGALVFLASEASSYVTGQNIIIDGGLNAW